MYSIVSHYAGRNNASSQRSQAQRGVQRSAFTAFTENTEEQCVNISKLSTLKNIVLFELYILKVYEY